MSEKSFREDGEYSKRSYKDAKEIWDSVEEIYKNAREKGYDMYEIMFEIDSEVHSQILLERLSNEY